MKELLLYSGIYDFVAEDIIKQINDNSGDEITLRLNTPGGSVLAGWGIIAKMIEHGNVNVKIDGGAMSMGAVIVAFAKNVEALDVSTIMIHKASMYVSNDQDQKYLDDVNKKLQTKLNAKIDSEKLKALKGVSIDDLFAEGERINLFLSAKEAKQIGLVNKITTLKPEEATAMNHRLFDVAAIADEPHDKNKNSNQKMTIKELQANHPELYDQLMAAGAKAEKNRVLGWLPYMAIDSESVIKGIKSDEGISDAERSEFHVKSMQSKTINTLETQSPANVATQEATAAKTEKEKSLEDFEKSVDTVTNINLKQVK